MVKTLLETHMKIGISAPIVEPHPTGVGFYSINLVNELSKLYDNLLLYTSHPSAFELDQTKIRRVSQLTRPQHGLTGFLSRIIWMQTFLPVRTLLDHASVILSTGSEGTLLPPVPQVVTVHDITPLVLPTLHPHKSELFFFRYLLPRVLRHSAAVIAVSESTKEDLIKVYHLPSEKIHVIYNGYDTMLFYPREDARDVIRSYGFKDYIHYAGNILPHKNVARLIRAFKLIAPKIPHQLVLQGWFNSTYMSELETLVRDLNIEDRVVFLGYVPLDHLPYLYSGATVFVTVSLYEGFGLPPLEAMACGTPVVASNSSSLPEVVGNAGILVDPNDTKQISEGLLRVIEHPELRAELSRKAVRRAASFSWVATARQALEVLKGVTSAQNDKRHIQAILG